MLVGKACPVVTRAAGHGTLDLLVFRHPLAGMQLVKGTIESGESAAEAALRELHEESGVKAAIAADLRSSTSIAAGEKWHFFHCSAEGLAENWTHHTADGGGLDFAFSWWPLRRPATAEWHPVFVRALGYVAAALG